MSLKLLTKLAFLAFIAAPGAANAAVISYSFSQGGFSEGASVTGAFDADDLNGNGQISTFDGEVSGFSISFSGNSIITAFTLGFADLFGLVYDLDGDIGDGIVLDIEGIGADDGSFFYIAGPGPFDLCGIAVDCAEVGDAFDSDFSQEMIFVSVASSVPEPMTLGLLTAGLLGIGALRRRA
jgi:hypothetical protein